MTINATQTSQISSWISSLKTTISSCFFTIFFRFVSFLILEKNLHFSMSYHPIDYRRFSSGRLFWFYTDRCKLSPNNRHTQFDFYSLVALLFCFLRSSETSSFLFSVSRSVRPIKTIHINGRLRFRTEYSSFCKFKI